MTKNTHKPLKLPKDRSDFLTRAFDAADGFISAGGFLIQADKTVNGEKELTGRLEASFETGTEGVVWSINAATKKNDTAFYRLKDGDVLEVFQGDKTVWKDTIDLDLTSRLKPYPLNPKLKKQELLGFWVNGIQRNTNAEKWGKFFFKCFRAKVTIK